MTKEIKKEEQTTALVNKEALLARANGMDTDADRAISFERPPRLEINNQMIEKKAVIDGKEEIIEKRCDPEFVLLGDKDNEYKKELFADTFEGILLTTTYKILRKGDEETRKAFPTFFHSLEFDTYDGDCVVIVSGEKQSFPMSFKQFQENYKGTYTRFTYAYVLIEDKIHILALKPSSGRLLNKYKADVKKSGSHFSLQVTKFGAKLNTDGDIKYNELYCESVRDVADDKVGEIMDMREDLIKTIKQFNTPKNQSDTKETTVEEKLVDAGMIEAPKDEVTKEEMPTPTF